MKIQCAGFKKHYFHAQTLLKNGTQPIFVSPKHSQVLILFVPPFTAEWRLSCQKKQERLLYAQLPRSLHFLWLRDAYPCLSAYSNLVNDF